MFQTQWRYIQLLNITRIRVSVGKLRRTPQQVLAFSVSA